MLEKKEAVSILEKAGYASGENEEISAASLHFARVSKYERLTKIADDTTNIVIKSVCAAIELSRIWRGFHCRKHLHQVFGHDKQIREKIPVIPTIFSIEVKPSSVLELHQESENSLREIESLQEVKIAEEQFVETVAKSSSSGIPEVTNTIKVEPKLTRVITNKSEAATIIQRSWRKHIDMQVFRYYRDLINFRGQGDPGLMLRCINPTEAKLLDAAAGVHIRFRLAGEKFPPNIYYKIYTHRPIVDMCANSPKDYTAPDAKSLSSKQVHNKSSCLETQAVEKIGWYVRNENNGWRLVSDRLIYASMDPVTWETSKKKVEFHHVKLQRKADMEHRRRQRKIQWMKKMYKEGMLRAKESDQETSELVEKAARGLVNTVNVQGSQAVMDWEVDELLQWTTALNFDDYLESWKETATSDMSEHEIANIKSGLQRSGPGESSGAVGSQFHPFDLTRASSVGLRQSPPKLLPEASGSAFRSDSRPMLESHETRATDDELAATAGSSALRRASVVLASGGTRKKHLQQLNPDAVSKNDVKKTIRQIKPHRKAEGTKRAQKE